jgi:hypothetical protein
MTLTSSLGLPFTGEARISNRRKGSVQFANNASGR